jgi:hypothetical protein
MEKEWVVPPATSSSIILTMLAVTVGSPSAGQSRKCHELRIAADLEQSGGIAGMKWIDNEMRGRDPDGARR